MIDGIKIKNVKVSADSRGDFREILRISDNLTEKIAQISIGTTHPGQIKAFHWHRYQDDIFYVISGNIQLVLYDGRSVSKTKGETQVMYLGESYSPQAVFIPRGVYHGYKVLADKNVQVLYMMNNQYNPAKPDEERLEFDNKKIGFNWKDKVLVIGAGGYLGTELMKDMSKDYQVKGTYYPEEEKGIHLNITNKKQVRDVLKRENPDIVILTAAKTNVEAYELDPKDTMKINVAGVKNVADCLKHQKLVFYSTDSVFDGTKSEYTEEDTPNPINVYSKSKFEAEKIVSSYPNHLICRTSRLYGAHGQKFLNKIIENLKSGKLVEVPEKTPGNFSLLEDVSNATIELIKKDKKGIYHVAGRSTESFAEAAFEVAEILGFDKTLIKKVGRDHFNSKVKRPTAVLNSKKLKNEGIKMSTLKEGLQKIKKQLKK